jgi:hypothetical protein
MKFREFEGTPEEFLRVGHLFGSSAPNAQTPAPPSPVSSGGGQQISPELILRVLSRRPLSGKFRRALRALRDADAEGLTTTEIAAAAGITRAQLAGVFGAFGRRVANTSGWPEGISFVQYARSDDEEGEWRYWLSETVKGVLHGGNVRL